VVDLNFISPFVVAAVDALKVQGGSDVEAEKPFLKGTNPIPPLVISAQMGITSSQFKGAITISFEEKVFLKIVSHMFSEQVTAIDDENQDAAAELLNMIYGAAKTALNPQGWAFERAIPVVVRGSSLHTSHGRLPSLVIPLRAAEGYIFIEIAVQQLMNT
jgi:chemotaxis protein CheX